MNLQFMKEMQHNVCIDDINGYPFLEQTCFTEWIGYSSLSDI